MIPIKLRVLHSILVQYSLIYEVSSQYKNIFVFSVRADRENISHLDKSWTVSRVILISKKEIV